MEHEPLEQESVLTNEQLFWLAYTPSADFSELSSLGDKIEERADLLAVELHKQHTDGEVYHEQAMEWFALKAALRHVDHTYGQLTGFRRNGCAMGAPVRYGVAPHHL
jgi:hypothetical protein